MTAPEFEIPAGAPRPGISWGWLLVMLLLGFFVFDNLVGYLSRDQGASGDRAEFQRIDLTLRQVVLMSQLEQLSASRPETKAPAPKEPPKRPDLVRPPGEARKSLDGDASLLAQKRGKSAEATFYYVILRHEQGYPAAPEDLARLRESEVPAYQAAATIYADAPPQPAQLSQLKVDLGDETFAARLAAVHARERMGETGARKELASLRNIIAMLLAGGVLMGALILGPALLFSYWAVRRSGRWTPLGLPSGVLSEDDSDRYAMRAGQMVLVWVAGNLLSAALFVRLFGLLGGLVAGAALTMVGVLVLTKVPVRGLQIGFDRIGLSTRDFGRHALWGIGGAIANAPLIMVTFALTAPLTQNLPPPEHPIAEQLRALNSLGGIMTFTFLLSVSAPFWEEIAFRGALLPAMVGKLKSPVWGVVGSSLLFAAVHPTGVPAWPMLAMVGAMGAMLTFQTRNLWPAIIMHAVHNGTIFLLQLSLL